MKILITLIITLLPILYTSSEKELPNYISTRAWFTKDSIEDCIIEEQLNNGYYFFAVDNSINLLEEYGFIQCDYKDYYEYPLTSHEEYLFLYLENKIDLNDKLTKDFNELVSQSKYNIKFLGLFNKEVTGFFSYPIEPLISETPFMYNKIDKITYDVTNTKSIQFIVTSLEIYDVIDKEIPLESIDIYLDEYSENRETPGIYNVNIRVKNSRDKYMFHTIVITIVNNTLPTLLIPTSFTVSTSIEMDMQYITNTIIARDYEGNDLEVVIYYDNYLLNRLEGIYTIQFSTTDRFNQTVYSSTTINVIKSDIEFYTYDSINIIIDTYKDFTNEELIYLLQLVKKDYYDNEIIADNQIDINKGYNYVFFDITDLDIEERLHISFNNIEYSKEINIIEEKFNFKVIFIILIAISVICCGGFIIYDKITKKV